MSSTISFAMYPVPECMTSVFFPYILSGMNVFIPDFMSRMKRVNAYNRVVVCFFFFTLYRFFV